ncbi:MAG: tetratricopeptide repeat protein [Spirochaetaceae bacterium]|jgi:tetratricopeptide (TPR) repeat protein|nr:tetratricopeptide repeat protein [Spirochaetaceae bacterium]
MKFRTCRYAIFFLMLFGFFPYPFRTFLYAQVWQPSLNESGADAYAQISAGIELYGDGRWGEAIIQLRRVQQGNMTPQLRAEAQFWIAMSAFAAGDYKEAIQNFDEIPRIDPGNIRCAEVPYHKGRANYYLKQYNEAINLLSAYTDSLRIDGRYSNGVRMSDWSDNDLYSNPEGNYNRKSAAIYWMGECFYALGDLARAEELLNIVVKEYPTSHKFEPATNRLALIKQKKIESELLNILKSVPSESGLPSGGAEQRQSTEEAILEYKKRIAPYLISEAYNEQMSGGAASPGTTPVTGSAAGTSAARPGFSPATPSGTQLAGNALEGGKDTGAIMRLLTVKTTALEMMDRLVSALNTYETIEDERW